MVAQTTLTQYLKNHTTPELASTITTLATASVAISQLLNKGALAGIHGEAGNQNVQGEAQKKLDVISNDLLLNALTHNPNCAGVASEELDEINPANDNGTLLVAFDPLDGSSNIDINMTVGTIFSILPYRNQGQKATEADFFAKRSKPNWGRLLYLWHIHDAGSYLWCRCCHV